MEEGEGEDSGEGRASLCGAWNCRWGLNVGTWYWKERGARTVERGIKKKVS